MKKLVVCTVFLMGLLASGCGSKKATVAVQAAETPEKKKEMVANIFTAVNKHDYDKAQQMITSFVDLYPGDPEIASFKLMVADVSYEQKKFAEAYEAYRHFQDYYPADLRAEYAAYKAAHAKFHQAHHVTCDSGPVEDTLKLCRDYMAHSEYVRYRNQIEDLARTCQHNLLDKELFVVNSYLSQQRYASARHRLDYVANKFDLDQNGKDHYLFCKAKLAKAENNKDELVQLVDDLHGLYPQSQFTAMADRLVGKRGVLFS